MCKLTHLQDASSRLHTEHDTLRGHGYGQIVYIMIGGGQQRVLAVQQSTVLSRAVEILVDICSDRGTVRDDLLDECDFDLRIVN